jgi:hypothetical protein
MLDPRSAGRHVRQQGERLVQMPRVLPHDLLRDPQVGEPELLGQARKVADRRQIVLQLSYR